MWKQTTLQESTDFSSGSTMRLKWCHWQPEEGVLHPDKFKLDLVVSGNKKIYRQDRDKAEVRPHGEGVGDCSLVKEPTLFESKAYSDGVNRMEDIYRQDMRDGVERYLSQGFHCCDKTP